MRLIRGSLPATLAAFVVALVAVGGSAIAAHHYLITSKSEIKPSVLNALRGRQGPAGPQGSAGPPGPQGAQGPAGPSNLGAIVEAKSARVAVAPESVHGALALCPPGTRAISGGGAAILGKGAIEVSEGENGRSGWFVIGHNESVIEGHIEAIAYCAQSNNAVAASAGHGGMLRRLHALEAQLAALRHHP
jgi:hypothetical protein